MLDGMLDQFSSNTKIAKKEKIMFDCKQIFDPTFSGSSNKIFMLDWFTPCFIQHFILVKTFRMVKHQISSNSTKLKRSAKQEQSGEEYEDAAEEI